MKTLNRQKRIASVSVKQKTEIDAVKMMREIRNKISSETKDMSFEQLKKYIAGKTKNE